MMLHSHIFMMNTTINLISKICHECERMKDHVIIFWEYIIITHLSLINIRLHHTSIYMHPCMRFMTHDILSALPTNN